MTLEAKLRVIQAIAFDFDGVFTDDRVLVSENGEESVLCSRADGLGIEALRKLGIPMIIISKERNPVVASRATKLSMGFVQGCDDKLPVLKEWIRDVGATPEQSAYMGNDVNDLDCLRFVGLPVAPRDARPEVLSVARFVTKQPGGRGAIREFADAIVAARAQAGR